MRRLVVLLLVVIAVAPGCGPSELQACDDYAVAWCTQQYKCQTGAALANLQTTYGPTAAACEVTYANPGNLDCGSAQLCPVGTSYDTGLAETCVTDTKNQSCTDVMAHADPQSCNKSIICH